MFLRIRLWLVALAVMGTFAWACGDDSTAPSTEAQLRSSLGVPPGAARVLILSQSSHLDWDWRKTFEDYYQSSVDAIFTDALQLLTQYHTEPAHYYYSIAEVAYLQRFVAAHPDLIEPLRQVGEDLRIVGGGITSPDNLLPSGEAFIRDYLIGTNWVRDTLGLPVRQAWLPDDFGHDAQLPIVIEAMGLQGVGFARVPGVDTSAEFLGIRPPAQDSIATQLLHDGLDFVWQASDGSEMLAHWMPGGYCQGDPTLGRALSTVDDIRQVLATNQPASPTPYIFVPIGCDFQPPKANIPALVQMWNAQQYAATGVWAVQASFDHYEQLVDAHREALRIRSFDPTPYWTGFYASRPLLKSLHLRATQALLGAEVFGAIADATTRQDDSAWITAVRARTAAIDADWALLVPGNHHDFITGTALDPVYQNEQLPRLQQALAQGEAARTSAMNAIAAAITPLHAGAPDVVVFNQLGFARQDLAEVSGAADDLLPGTIVQPSAEGGTLFVAQVPSLGYATADQAAPAGPSPRPVTIAMSADGESVVLENAALRATISRVAGWSITSLIDLQTNNETVAAGQAANSFQVYHDDGGLYRFGDEMAGCNLTPDSAAEIPGDLTILESGPLRARVRATLTLDAQTITKEYLLVVNEPFVRMRSTGAAPEGTSVLVRFPLAGSVDDFVYGTAYHWNREPPARAGSLTFEATHDFLITRLRGSPRAAVFQTGVPAWAVQPDGTVVGALWRNAEQERCDIYGAFGTAADAHTAEYALRVASGIVPPEQGAQWREALAFEIALQAIVATPAGALPRGFALASASPDAALITAAKATSADARTLLLRIDQPTNAPLQVAVRTAVAQRFPPGWHLGVQGRTALETALSPARAAELALSGSAQQFDFTAARALTTIAIERND